MKSTTNKRCHKEILVVTEAQTELAFSFIFYLF